MGTINQYGDNSLQGNFKQVYADEIARLMPDHVKLLKKLDFVAKDKQPGGYYNQPVQLSYCHGFTYAAPMSPTPQLNSSVTSVLRFAQVDGYQVYGREQLSYDALMRSENKKGAFEDSKALVMKTLMLSMAHRMEAEILYGQNNWGTVAAVAGNTVTVTTQEWASGLWIGAVGMPVSVYTAAGVFVKDMVVVTIDTENRAIVFDNAAGVVATHVLYPKGEFGNAMAGLHKILRNTGSLFGLDASVYDLWKTPNYDAGAAALTFNKLLKANALATAKGMSGDSDLYCNENTYRDLVNEFESARTDYADQVARQHVERGTKGEDENALIVHGTGGSMKIRPHSMVKEGYAYCIKTDDFLRVGATDITFKFPGIKEEGAVFSLENTPALEIRIMADFGIFTPRPAHAFCIYNITNTL